MTTDNTHIINWINSHPLICIHRLAKATGIAGSTLYKYLNGTRVMRPEHEKQLCDELSNYGYHHKSNMTGGEVILNKDQMKQISRLA